MIENKEAIKSYFEAGKQPTQTQFESLIDSQVGVAGIVSDLPDPEESQLGVCYLVDGDKIYRCELINGEYRWTLKAVLVSPTDYANLINKPQINGVALAGNKTASELGLIKSSFLSYLRKINPGEDDVLFLVDNSDKQNVKYFYVNDLLQLLSSTLNGIISKTDLTIFLSDITNNKMIVVNLSDQQGSYEFSFPDFDKSIAGGWAKTIILKNTSEKDIQIIPSQEPNIDIPAKTGGDDVNQFILSALNETQVTIYFDGIARRWKVL